MSLDSTLSIYPFCHLLHSPRHFRNPSQPTFLGFVCFCFFKMAGCMVGLFLGRKFRPDLICSWLKSGHKASAIRWGHNGGLMSWAAGGSSHGNLEKSTPPWDLSYLTKPRAGHSLCHRRSSSPSPVISSLINLPVVSPGGDSWQEPGEDILLWDAQCPKQSLASTTHPVKD